MCLFVCAIFSFSSPAAKIHDICAAEWVFFFLLACLSYSNFTFIYFFCAVVPFVPLLLLAIIFFSSVVGTSNCSAYCVRFDFFLVFRMLCAADRVTAAYTNTFASTRLMPKIIYRFYIYAVCVSFTHIVASNTQHRRSSELARASQPTISRTHI